MKRRTSAGASVHSSPGPGWHVEAPGFLGWLQAVLVWLALAVALTAAVLALPGRELRFPGGFAAVAWIVLLLLALVWLVRLGSYLLNRQVLGGVFSLSGVLGHLFLLLGLAASRGLGGLLGVFSLFLAAGEILRLVELRAPSPPGWLRRGHPLLPPRIRMALSTGCLAAYFLLVFASFR